VAFLVKPIIPSGGINPDENGGPKLLTGKRIGSLVIEWSCRYTLSIHGLPPTLPARGLVAIIPQRLSAAEAVVPSAFYLPENPEYTLLDSARDSVRFAHYCLEALDQGRWRATSSLVDPDGRPAHGHGLAGLEGPGWAANALGGARNLYAWGRFDNNHILQKVALGLIDHVLEDGFLQPDGFIWPYRVVGSDRQYLNFKHNDVWFCPGWMAKTALQMLWLSDTLDHDPRVLRLRSYAPLTAQWLLARLLPSEDWYPRRCTSDGTPCKEGSEGGPDPLAYSSAAGLYIVWLLLELSERGIGTHAEVVRQKLEAIIRRDGIYGSIDPAGSDLDTAAGRAVAYRLFRRASRSFRDPSLGEFAVEDALAGLERLQVTEDMNGVVTKGLVRSAPTRDTANLWENAEVSLAYLEAFEDTQDRDYLCNGVTILRAIAKHHNGPNGFLADSVDWSTPSVAERDAPHLAPVSSHQTTPLQSNLHHTEPILRYLEHHVV
jgi:hypothetical protein